MLNQRLCRPSRALTRCDPYPGLTSKAILLRPFGAGDFVASLYYAVFNSKPIGGIPRKFWKFYEATEASVINK